MIADDSTQEESTDTDIPNEDARTDRTCLVCGETDDRVDMHGFFDDRPSFPAHHGCLPNMTIDFEAWYAENIADKLEGDN